MAQQPGVTNFVKAGVHIPFQYPLRSGAVRERGRTLLHGISTASFLPEPVGIRIGGCFGDGG
jgi:hypothetical protein